MPDQSHTEFSWNKLAKRAIVGTKVILVLTVLCVFINLTVENVPLPYRIYAVIAELAITISSIFTLIRINTARARATYDLSKLQGLTQEGLLLQNITFDIAKFEESASFYFTGIRIYKYSTMFLAGLSTILLGLSLKGLVPDSWLAIYPELAKNIAFVIGAIITVYTGLMGYWNIEKYWIQNKSIANKLKALKDKIENQDRAQKLTTEEVQKRFEEYQAIKGDYYKYWEGALSAHGSQSSASK